MPRSPSDPDPLAAARAFVGNPETFRPRLDAAEWADLHATSWAILRNARPPRDPAAGCTVTVIPRAVFEAHAHPRRPLPALRVIAPRDPSNPGDAA